MKHLRILLLLLLWPSPSGEASPTVGIEGHVEVLLPRPELKAKPADRAAPLTLRIASTRPHGTLIEYDLRYIGLVPGQYDLRSFLVQQDGSPAAELPPIPVQVTGVLPPQHQGQLAPRSAQGISIFGKYKWLLIGAAALWVILAVPLFLMGRRDPKLTATPVENAPPTLVERLRPLIQQASAGELTVEGKAKLERLLLGHWRQRLDLESLDTHVAMARLREHPQAGALLRALEDWLHRRPGAVKVDVESVLAPYATPLSSNGAESAGAPGFKPVPS